MGGNPWISMIWNSIRGEWTQLPVLIGSQEHQRETKISLNDKNLGIGPKKQIIEQIQERINN